MTSDRYDVVIIGGGATGCSTAVFLGLEPGFDGKVLVVERDPTYENAPSAKATGGFRQQFSIPENISMGLFGIHFIKHLDEYLGIDEQRPDVAFRESGYLLLATEQALPTMRESNDLQRKMGADIAWRSPDELNERFPWLALDGLVGGFLSNSNEGHVDPWLLLQAYRRKAKALGTDFIKDEVVALHKEGERIVSLSLAGGGEIACRTVVNAAGASGARGICKGLGIDLPIEPRKRCTFVFECRGDVGIAPFTITEKGLVFRSDGGRFISNFAPPPDRDPPTLDADVDYSLFDDFLWPELARRVPAFEAIRLTGAWCCHYDYNTLDQNLIIGRTPWFENFLLAAGFSGHGLQQSPAVGRALSELITYGEYRTIDLARFGYERALKSEALMERNCY
ncbi:MAG: FAD-binding oxidoreductase [Ectothiorhodospiraceae bacterium AqS1]|nr:FAD-binding oxidoreductase [Ectothiorhodospiraceae bacterium AqS1]